MNNRSIVLLGDVHGDVYRCLEVCNQNPKSTVVQIGDLGIGFKVPTIIGGDHHYDGVPVDSAVRRSMPVNFRFFCGNHDNRTLASTLKSCLGDFGEFGQLFFVSGARSIDADMRIPGVSWWDNEELTRPQADVCLASWIKSDRRILVSHDAPLNFAGEMLSHHRHDRSLTQQLLQAMVDARKPELVVFGHHHKPTRKKIDGVKYVCLGIGEAKIIEG